MKLDDEFEHDIETEKDVWDLAKRCVIPVCVVITLSIILTFMMFF